LTPLPWLVGCHLLAGHYNLAFINLMVSVIWFLARMFWVHENRHHRIVSHRAGAILCVAGMLALGFALAAPQVLATWELKQLSQRVDVGAAHNPGYGHIPPLYLSQVIAPWMWYPPEIDFDRVVQQLSWGAYPAATNKVESHLYFGMLPLVMAIIAASRLPRESDSRRAWLVWIALAVTATVYTTGWLLPITQHLPGFNYFIGPGRYGIVTTLVVALLAGKELAHWTGRSNAADPAIPRAASVKQIVLAAVVLIVTLLDLWIVSRWVFYAEPVAHAPLEYRNESQLREMALELGPEARLFAPGSNLATLTGFAASPPYLGLGPAEYFDPELRPPYSDVREVPAEKIEQQVAWLRRAGVTHLLCFDRLSPEVWPVEVAWEGHDDMLNRAWARPEPLYLYRLLDAPGRVRLISEEGLPLNTAATISLDRGDTIEIAVNAPSDSTLVLADLWYPGWEVEVDGAHAQGRRHDNMFRAVDVPAGPHVVKWSYRPPLVRWGYLVSGLTILIAVVLILTTCLRGRDGV
jgi:hypothetical protein